MSVYVNNSVNSVDVNPLFNTVNVIPDGNSTIVQVIAPGPQGPPGDPTELTGSFVSFTEFNEFTSSYNTGSFIGLFNGTFIGDGSGLTGIPTSNWTGSTDGSITRESNVYVTGSFGVTNQTGTSLFLINAQGTTTVKGTATNIFLVQNQNNISLLTVLQSGVIVVATQSIELSSQAPNGGMYFTSSSLFIGID
jgi:hypothetical protein